MYNEKIEGLIKAALADGVLTEKEKQILFKKAQEEGIDLDEFEMVLDARLVELKKEEKEKAEKSAPKSNKYGDVRKCPVCGALVPALSGACPECGYEFSGVGANSSSKELADKIEKINDKFNKQILSIRDYQDPFDPGRAKRDRWRTETQKYEAIAHAIESFSIPNTKADLFEFITTTQAGMLDPYTYKIVGKAYARKYQESILKARNLFRNDKVFESLLADQEKAIKEYKKARRSQKEKRAPIPPQVWGILGLIGMFLFFCLVLYLMS